jgi:predicted  nucleic acid-binding Zn ribbon protein
MAAKGGRQEQNRPCPSCHSPRPLEQDLKEVAEFLDNFQQNKKE